MIIPYKVKNPPKHFPVVTITIIAINLIVYGFTTHYGLAIREDIVDQYAMKWGASPLYTLITAIFLHAGPFHLVGNMLFLWVFGPAVEDRLRPALYVLLYCIAGFAGDVAQAALGVTGAVGAAIPTIGASGAIMGVLGAYWYLYSWSRVCVFYWFFLIIWGTAEIAAFWIIGAYFLLDLLNGWLARDMGVGGGVANFAHVGGAVAGAVLVWALQFKRDSGEVSRVKATQAEMRSLELLSCDELAKLTNGSPEDEELLLSYARRAWEQGDMQHLSSAIKRNSRAIITNCPDAVVDYVFQSTYAPDPLTAGDVMYLGRLCEGLSRPERALLLYERLQSLYPYAPEIELALYRGAWICRETYRNTAKAAEKLRAQLEKFPNGPHCLDAEDLLRDIDRPGGANAQAA